jgi:hypothetical protein
VQRLDPLLFELALLDLLLVNLLPFRLIDR